MIFTNQINTFKQFFWSKIYPASFESYKDPIFYEGGDAVIALYQDKNSNSKAIFINGLKHGNTLVDSYDQWVSLPLEINPRVNKVLIIGLGAGNVLRKVNSLGIKDVTLVEISPTLIEALSSVPDFKESNFGKNVKIIIDDGRSFLSNKSDLYDLIIVDHHRPHTAFSNNLFSMEFMQKVRESLAPKGLYSFGTINKTVLLNTANTVFKGNCVYGHLNGVCSKETIDQNIIRQLISKDLLDMTTDSSELAHYPIITDDNMLMEYYLGFKYKVKNIISTN